jgi:hypothetical protein
MSFSHFTDLVDTGVAIGVATGVEVELSAPPKPLSFIAMAMASCFHLY